MPDQKHLRRAKQQTATIDLGDGDTVNLVYDANSVTPRWMGDVMQLADQADILALAKALEAVLISWDVTDDGAEWPPTADNIASFSFPVVNALFEEVCKAAAPGEAEGNASSPSVSEPPSGSVPASQTSLNGSDGSISPTPSESLSVK